MTVEHSGRIRTYMPPFSLRGEIPQIGDIIEKTPIATSFVNHVTMNHRGLNWKIFRYNLNVENYRSFIIAFALVSRDASTSESKMWQFDANARRLEKALRRNKIKLTKCERRVVSYCKEFSKCKDRREFRKNYMSNLLRALKQQYSI